MIKAKDSQGSRFASLGQQTLPYLQALNWPGGTEHYDPYPYDRSRPIDAKYMDAIERGKRVLLTRDEVSNEGKKKRLGYIGVFDIDDVTFGPDGFRCRIVGRVG